MSEDRVEEPFAVQEIWLDGFSGVHIRGETLRCTAFSVQEEHPVAVVKLVMTLQTARHFCALCAEVMGEHARLKIVRKRRPLG